MKSAGYFLFAAVGASVPRLALADGVPQPLISPDDRGTDAFLARYTLRASVAATEVRTSDATAGLYSLQGFVGPWHDTALEKTSFRFRFTAASGSDSDFRAGPLAFAMQRYFPIEPVFAAPLLALHFGIEGAIATPWLSGQRAAPPAALTALGLETELAGNGWDFRPSGWVRLDFLACRNFYFELGGGPEVFAPTSGPDLVALRYRVALGFDVGCDGRDLNQIARPGLIVEYRARGVVHAGAADPYYDDLLSGALQWVLGPVTLGLTYGFDTQLGARVFGARVQTGVVDNR